MRDVGKCALRTDFGNGFVGRYKQHARTVEPSVDKPFVRRGVELSAELLFERRERAVGRGSQRFERNFVEDVGIDGSREEVACRVGVVENFRFQATIVARQNHIEQFAEFYAVIRGIVAQIVVGQRTIDAAKELAYRIVGMLDDEILRLTTLAGVAVRVVGAVVGMLPENHGLQHGGRDEECKLLESALFGCRILFVVNARIVQQHVAFADLGATVSAINLFAAFQYVIDCYALEHYRGHASIGGLGKFDQ